MGEGGGNRYLQIIRPGVSELREGPIPIPGPGQVVVRIEAITTCPHWDLHLASLLSRKFMSQELLNI